LLDDSTFSPLIKKLLMDLHAHFSYLDDRIKALDKEVHCQAASDDLASRLMSIPCIGPITATALAAELGDGKQFRCGRDYSVSIGLVPRQHTTGGKPCLGRISKRGMAISDDC
jgi:transposase